jgi:signal peptidase II
VKKSIILGGFILVTDLSTKFFVDRSVDVGSSVSIVSFLNFFNITNISNTGAIFNIFQGKNLFLSLTIFILLFSLFLWLYNNKDKITKIQKYSFCVVIAGGLGNLIDRLFHGAVIDFLDFGINFLRWPSFNIADLCICIAMILLFTDILIFNKK